MTQVKKTIIASLILWASLAFYYVFARTGGGTITFGLIQDVSAIYGFYPWDMFSLRELKAGYFPLWNPLNALGEPHIANMQTAVFYPLTWLKFLFGMSLTGLDLILLLRLYLAGIFTYLFARRLGLGFAASVVSAISFMLTGYFTRHVYMSHLNVEILIPLILLVFNELSAKGGVKWFVASAAVVWLTIVGGFPEATFYTLLFGAIYFLWVAPLFRWPLLPSAAIIGFFAASVQSLPFLEYMSHAWFYHPTGIGHVHNDIKYFFTLWEPWFFGTNDVSPLVPFLTPYFGLVPMVLAISAIRKGGVGRRWFFVAALVLCLGLVYGIPPISWLTYIPPFDITLNYKYAVPTAAFCVAILAGMGANDLLEGLISKRVIFYSALFVVVYLVVIILDKCSIFKPYSSHSYFFPDNQIPWVLWLAIYAWLPKKQKNLIGFMLIMFMIILPFDGNRAISSEEPKETITSPEVKYLSSHRNLGRFTASDHIIPPDLNLLLGLNDLRYYNPMYNSRYANFIMRINNIKDDAGLRQHFANHAKLTPEQNAITGDWLDYAALQWWIGEGPPGTVDLLPELTARADWRTVRQDMIGGENFMSPTFSEPLILAHAPSEISLKIRIPEKGSLRFKPSMRGCGCCLNSDGADFILVVENQTTRKVVFSKFLDQTKCNKEFTVPLLEFAGKDVTLRFVTKPGPHGDNTNDQTEWVGPSLGNVEPEGWTRLSQGLDRVWERNGEPRWGWMDGKCSGAKVDVRRISSQNLEVKSPSCSGWKTVISYVAYPGWRAFSKDGEVKMETSTDIFQAMEGGGNFQLKYEPLSFRIGLWASIVTIILSVLFILKKSNLRCEVGAKDF